MARDSFTRWLEQPGPPACDEEELMWQAWQASRAEALREAYNAMFDIKGDKITRFDAQTAIRNLAAPADPVAWLEPAKTGGA